MTMLSSTTLDVLDRRSLITTAALRAAYAWSVRALEPRAFDEIARMTGVIMYQLGPGQGPTTPMELIDALRHPLGDLLPQLAGPMNDPYGTGIETAILLSLSGELSEDAYDVGCDFIRDLIGTRDPGRDWLPEWSWMRANQVEHAVFGQLRDSGTEKEYRDARCFLIELPAGDRDVLADTAHHRQAKRVAKYVPIAAEQTLVSGEGRWWWPCPVCKWPMHVDELYIRCRYRPHGAQFQLGRPSAKGGAPTVIPVSVSHLAGPRLLVERPTVPEARDADGAVQLEHAIWRYITVPGVPEVRMKSVLEGLGARATLYPGYDKYDLHLAARDLEIEIDVKEHMSIEALMRHLREKPPAASHIVLPDSHQGQAPAIRDRFPNYKVWTESYLYRKVKEALGAVQ